MQAVHMRAAENEYNVNGDDCETDHREYRKPPKVSCVKNAGSAECHPCKEEEHDQ